ncbi:MAG: helix-turn-helix domain-containing protein [Cytophagales bacterium]|nr:helix-turn-helix domain-containing protein [Cytophagales bacterium]
MIISLLGVFNGLFLTFYFLWGKSKQGYQNIYLGLMLLALVLRIGKSVFYYFNRGLDEAYIMIGLMACVAIGPFSFFFVRSQLSGNKRFDYRSLFTLIPILFLMSYAFFVESYWENKPLWSNYILRGIYVYWGIFSLTATGLVLRKRYVKKESFPNQNWTLGVTLGVTFIWLTYMTSSFTSYLAGAITFTFLVYLLVWILFARGKATDTTKSKAKSNWSDREITGYKTKIEATLTNDGRYKDANLTMPNLAKEIGLTPHQFSLFINDHLGKNFSHLINEVRIGAAKEMLHKDHHLTVEAIAYECGFNATSTFHTAFKNVTGMTPAAFRKQVPVPSDL